MELITQSKQQTQEIGEILGKKALQIKDPFFLALEGDLGSGKTTFMQGFAKGLEVKENITSPTFVIFKKYPAKEGKYLYHFDAYRITEKDLAVLNFEEIIKKENSVVAVEWSENIKGAVPGRAVVINLTVIDENKRRLIVTDNNDIIGDILPRGCC